LSSKLIAGVDEAGRGPLAGPVVAAAVIFGSAYPAGLRDSKQLSAARRQHLCREIQFCALAYAVGQADVHEIDALNIHHATLLAMARAVRGLHVAPDEVLVDGKHVPQISLPARAIVGGDASEPAISAASIVAKHTRDEIMLCLDRSYPAYGFAQHKGYPTRAHLSALSQHGVSPVHRSSFGPVRKLLGAQ